MSKGFEVNERSRCSGSFWFWAAISVYAISRLLLVDHYPIYFLYDEAMQSVLAADFIRSGYFGYAGQYIPVFFPSGGDWSISTTVYLHTPLVLLFGKSILASRILSAAISILAAISVHLILSKGVKITRPWLGILILSAIPTWFVFSRTSLVVAPMVSFYALFLASYVMYLQGRRAWLFIGALSAAAAYYCYSAAQVIIPITALALFLSDIKFHLKNWRWSGAAIFLAALLVSPALYFRYQHPELLEQQLGRLAGILTSNAPISKKISFVAENYLETLNPAYWFFGNEEIARHQMGPYNHILAWMFPFFCLGIVLCLLKIFKNSGCRLTLLTLLITPLSTALVGPSAIRAQAYVIPAAVLVALGLDRAISLLSPYLPRQFATTVFCSLSALCFFLLFKSLTEGPTWHKNYGLYGMQWGASELYDEALPVFLKRYPDAEFLISPHWANGGDVFSKFFDSGPRVKNGSLRDAIHKKEPEIESFIYVSPADEVDEAIKSGKFDSPEILYLLHYPDGSPGFYFARWRYSQKADDIFKQQALDRLKPEHTTVNIGGQQVEMEYSKADMGTAQSAFDYDTSTLLRGAQLNPFNISLKFANPVSIKSVKTYCGDPHYRLSIGIGLNDGESQTFEAVSSEKEQFGFAAVAIDMGNISELSLSIANTSFPQNHDDYTLPDVHIHIYGIDIEFNQ